MFDAEICEELFGDLERRGLKLGGVPIREKLPYLLSKGLKLKAYVPTKTFRRLADKSFGTRAKSSI